MDAIAILGVPRELAVGLLLLSGDGIAEDRECAEQWEIHDITAETRHQTGMLADAGDGDQSETPMRRRLNHQETLVDQRTSLVVLGFSPMFFLATLTLNSKRANKRAKWMHVCRAVEANT